MVGGDHGEASSADKVRVAASLNSRAGRGSFHHPICPSASSRAARQRPPPAESLTVKPRRARGPGGATASTICRLHLVEGVRRHHPTTDRRLQPLARQPLQIVGINPAPLGYHPRRGENRGGLRGPVTPVPHPGSRHPRPFRPRPSSRSTKRSPGTSGMRHSATKPHAHVSRLARFDLAMARRSSRSRAGKSPDPM